MLYDLRGFVSIANGTGKEKDVVLVVMLREEESGV